ncbi:cytochrome P450 [Streptomyces sp. NPDC059818]|uniref:cytochrome P450 n=1 Tax=Streptomyces sp. NPDC059818 TaxID=3346962 RepID=UPI003646A922
MTALLADPGQLAHVRAGRAGWSDAVEENLRHEPAVRHLPLRYALADIPLPDGQTMSRSEAILASYAANRHPGWHGESADHFDVTRPDKEHLAFGHGVHFCLGAPLARMEISAALHMLFDPLQDVGADPVRLRHAIERLSGLSYRSGQEIRDRDPRLHSPVSAFGDRDDDAPAP